MSIIPLIINKTESGGGGGGSSWGEIIGTISDQIDLQQALNAKQATLVSGTNIKSINGVSLLGSGDVVQSGFFDGGAASTVYAPNNRNIDGGGASG